MGYNSVIMKLEGNQIYLRRLTEDDVTSTYVRWLNDPDINQYLESRFCEHTIEDTRAFIRSVTNDSNYMFGIFDKATDAHIGNIKIGSINSRHLSADLGFMIGEKQYWGRGIATEAIRLATDYAFNVLHLHKLWGGAYEPNIGSMRAFEKNGYQLEAVFRKHCKCGDEYVDVHEYGKLNEDE